MKQQANGYFYHNQNLKYMQDLKTKRVALKDAIGKTIKAVAVDSEMHAITYEDGTFSVFGRFGEWDFPNQGDVFLDYGEMIKELGIRTDGSTYFTDLQKLLIEVGALDGDALVADAKERIDTYVAKMPRKPNFKYYLK